MCLKVHSISVTLVDFSPILGRFSNSAYVVPISINHLNQRFIASWRAFALYKIAKLTVKI